ncbi:MAG: SapC family protein [Gallionellaceae bacterium]|jgi:hypothetical protein
MSNFAFYKKVVALNSEAHRNLKIDGSKVDFSFAADTTAVLLAGIEFAEAGREYPIVFIRGQDQQFRPAALLGVREAENLFVDDEGQWDAAYIPAFVRRYPFVMAQGAEPDQLTVCIDEECSALSATQGDALFNAEGQLEPRMNEILKFLQSVQQDFARTELITKQFEELDLFVQQGARFDTASGETFQLNDFYLIDEAKFRQIPDDKLPALFRSGALGLAFLHLASLANMRKLLDRIAPRLSAEKSNEPELTKMVH